MTSQERPESAGSAESAVPAGSAVPEDEATVAVSRDADDTVDLQRGAGSGATGATGADETGATGADETTVDVDPALVIDDEATLAMSRDDDDTTPVARDDDATAAMSRDEDARNARPAHSSDIRSELPPMERIGTKPVMSKPRKRRRGRLHPAPVPAGYGERAVRASGAGAVSTYRARPIPRPPRDAPRLPETPSVLRITEGAPSVMRLSRRFAAGAIGGFAVCCLVSAVGLALIARAAFGL